MESKVVAVVKGEEGIEAVVAEITNGFSVVLRDSDSGEYLDSVRIFSAMNAAVAYANTINVGV